MKICVVSTGYDRQLNSVGIQNILNRYIQNERFMCNNPDKAEFLYRKMQEAKELAFQLLLANNGNPYLFQHLSLNNLEEAKKFIQDADEFYAEQMEKLHASEKQEHTGCCGKCNHGEYGCCNCKDNEDNEDEDDTWNGNILDMLAKVMSECFGDSNKNSEDDEDDEADESEESKEIKNPAEKLTVAQLIEMVFSADDEDDEDDESEDDEDGEDDEDDERIPNLRAELLAKLENHDNRIRKLAKKYWEDICDEMRELADEGISTLLLAKANDNYSELFSDEEYSRDILLGYLSELAYNDGLRLEVFKSGNNINRVVVSL